MSERTPGSRSPRPNNEVGALIGEYLAEKKRERAEEARQARRQRSRPLVVTILVVLCAVTAALPSFLDERADPLPAERIDTGTRLSVFLASERIRDFQLRTGRLPDNLREAGVDSMGLSYWRSTDSVFELSSDYGGSRVRYHSTAPSGEFLGPALRILGTVP